MKKMNTISLSDWLMLLEGGLEKNRKFKLLFEKERIRKK